jgi:hypothetical protein
MPIPQSVEIGQRWSIWVPGRRQWLLATVVRRADGQAALKYDARYGIGAKADEQSADESTMLTATNLFRLLEDV